MKTFSLNSFSFCFAFAVCLIFSVSKTKKRARARLKVIRKFFRKEEKNYLDGMSRMLDGELKKLQHLVIQIITL